MRKAASRSSLRNRPGRRKDRFADWIRVRDWSRVRDWLVPALACLIAALMSSADCYMVVMSALLVRNVYAPYIDPNASEPLDPVVDGYRDRHSATVMSGPE